MRGLVRRISSGLSAKRPAANGALELLKLIDANNGSGNFTAVRSCVALIYAFGPGGSGAAIYAQGLGGGGGGAAAFKCVKLSPGQSLGYSVGAPGAAVLPGTGDGKAATATIVRLPGGGTVTAGGGGGGTLTAGGAGGVATGGDLNRAGGSGGYPATAGGTGQMGGTGGLATSSGSGGGGAAGFLDQPAMFTGGAGSAGKSDGNSVQSGGFPGGGSGAESTGEMGVAAGGGGRVLIFVLRAR
jgi:hypothetical protein